MKDLERDLEAGISVFSMLQIETHKSLVYVQGFVIIRFGNRNDFQGNNFDFR